jgi:hypothetical protein
MTGRDSVFCIATLLRAGRYGHRISVEARFSAPIQAKLGVHSAFYTVVTRCPSPGKSYGMWHWQPTPSTAGVKERVGLYVYSPLWVCMACSRVNFTITLRLMIGHKVKLGHGRFLSHLSQSMILCSYAHSILHKLTAPLTTTNHFMYRQQKYI